MLLVASGAVPTDPGCLPGPQWAGRGAPLTEPGRPPWVGAVSSPLGPSECPVPLQPQTGPRVLLCPPAGPPQLLGAVQGSVLTTGRVSPASSRLRLAVLPEDQLQMKWRESEGGSLGYLVQVKPRAGKGSVHLAGPAAGVLVCAQLLHPSTHAVRGGEVPRDGSRGVSPMRSHPHIQLMPMAPSVPLEETRTPSSSLGPFQNSARPRAGL